MTKEEMFAHLDKTLGHKFGKRVDVRTREDYIDREFVMNIEKVDFHKYNSDGSFHFEIGNPKSENETTSKFLKKQGIVGLFKVSPKF